VFIGALLLFGEDSNVASKNFPRVTIRFESPELKLLVETPGTLFLTVFHGWRLSEVYEANRYRLGSERFGAYRVVMEFDASPADQDAGGAYIAGCFLARQLDRAWTYATGMTLCGFRSKLITRFAPS